MTMTQSLAAYILAASLLTITPGLDTALILRTSTTEGSRPGLHAALGINLGCMIWGASVALGLGAVLAASQPVFTILKWAGAGYMIWLGGNMILMPKTAWTEPSARGAGTAWFWKGLTGNLLNPKVGIFYVSFLPQFVPAGLPAGPCMLLFSVIHVGLGLIWSAVLIILCRPLGQSLRHPVIRGVLDRLTGCVLIAFGTRLALSRR